MIQSTHSFRQPCVTLNKTVEYFVKLVANDAIITHTRTHARTHTHTHTHIYRHQLVFFYLCFTLLHCFNSISNPSKPTLTREHKDLDALKHLLFLMSRIILRNTKIIQLNIFTPLHEGVALYNKVQFNIT